MKTDYLGNELKEGDIIGYIESMKTQIGFRAKGRQILKHNGVHQLREEMGTYNVNYDNEMGNIGIENTYYWDDNHRISEGYRGPTL